MPITTIKKKLQHHNKYFKYEIQIWLELNKTIFYNLSHDKIREEMELYSINDCIKETYHKILYLGPK